MRHRYGEVFDAAALVYYVFRLDILDAEFFLFARGDGQRRNQQQEVGLFFHGAIYGIPFQTLRKVGLPVFSCQAGREEINWTQSAATSSDRKRFKSGRIQC